MSAPFALSHDANGELRRSEGSVAVDDCAVETLTRDPRGRAPLPPGSDTCEVTVAWKGVGVRYPALIDPVWSTTGSMSKPRHAPLTLLADGRVLVTGGSGTSGDVTCEIYDPTSGTWSMTASLSATRRLHSATRLNDGRVLVIGGSTTTGKNTAEIFDPTAPSPTWQSAGTMASPRDFHTVTQLLNGTVLVAGPYGAPAELFDPLAVSNPWSSAGTQIVTRSSAAAALLQDGRVLIAGGTANTGNPQATTEFYDPNASGNPWSAGPNMSVARSLAQSVVIGSDVLVGTTTAATFDIFHFSTKQFTVGSPLPSFTGLRGLIPLPVGILEFSDTTAAVYDTGLSKWWSVNPPQLAIDVTATALLDGRALLAGGGIVGFMGPTLATATLFDPSDSNLYIGGECKTNSDCKSNACESYACCSAPCGLCAACRTTLTGQPNGMCAPVLAGTDPLGVCKDDGSPSCNLNGLCDGAGACQKYPSQSACDGSKCTTANDCASGFCLDSVCCTSGCTGACNVCSAARKGQGVDGVCDFIKAGLDPDNECPSTIGVGSCAGDAVCDGAGACMSAASGSDCGSTSCIGLDAQNNASTCSNDGTCTDNGIASCHPYVCSGIACLTSCTSQADCAAGAICVQDHCVTPKANGLGCSVAPECTSGFCVEGVCCDGPCDGSCESCLATNKSSGSTGTCGPSKPGAGCGTDGGADDAGGTGATGSGGSSGASAEAGVGGKSGSKSNSSDEDGGCGCRVGDRPRPLNHWLALALLGGVVLRRRWGPNRGRARSGAPMSL